MIPKAVLESMNNQIMHELYSAYFYLSMAAHFENENLPGFANWMKMQAKEEQEHALKFFEFIVDRGGKVTLLAIAQPPVEFGSPLDVFKQVYEHEQKVTALINDIYKVALKENDYASQVFLHWFIEEQVEEEKNASAIVDTLSRISSSVGGLYQLDHTLSKRGSED